MKRFLILMIAFTLLSLAFSSYATLAAGNSLYGKYLTVADVEKAAGIKGVIRKEVALTLEFYNAKNEKIVEARFYGPEFYQEEVGKNQKYYTTVAGIGEKAAYTLGDTPYRLTFAKGKFGVMVQTPFASAKDPKNKEFLMALGKVIVGRL
jgi:endonuclease III